MSGYVVYDCDAGTDDAWGLLMLIKGEAPPPKDTSCESRRGQYKILGVTCVQGNTDVDNVTKNVFRVLDSVDRTDIPIFKGCSQPILPRTWERGRLFHGKDGFGDLKYEEDIDQMKISQVHAVNAMYEFVCKHPKLVDFILVGPLTNFALCINMYGDDFLDKVRDVYIMGGNYRGKGNITKSAEFNFMMDPEAAHIALERIKTSPVILPWESCIDSDHGITMDWRFKELGSVRSKAMELMNRVETKILVPRNFPNWIVCDAMLVAAYIFPQTAISRSREYHVTVELNGTHTRGQMVLDHLRSKEHNSTIILEIQKRYYKNIIAWTGGLEDIKEQ